MPNLTTGLVTRLSSSRIESKPEKSSPTASKWITPIPSLYRRYFRPTDGRFGITAYASGGSGEFGPSIARTSDRSSLMYVSVNEKPRYNTVWFTNTERRKPR
jgi:hypothetical protein